MQIRSFLKSLALSVGILTGFSTGVAAVCMPYGELIEQWAERYNEAPASWGITTTGALFQVFASPEGTWTAIVVNPNGLIACTISAGAGWHPDKLPDGPET